MKQYRTIEQMCSDAHSITLKRFKETFFKQNHQHLHYGSKTLYIFRIFTIEIVASLNDKKGEIKQIQRNIKHT